ncbi:uncharacterized protein LOC126298611 [Schistocerca gregaria]|uniref:uncharacterized protein LOC126298611 n=1 Tax=Schistocerca gregaria TaxID=7010 RepID=UPI00211F12CC|nr:uncharacterized protein LOC126298611 [Schistocerca gregaria]XP_049845975.1 uncharacterized protein LOC126298611 [Schistocerca gregaria]
MFFSQRKCGIKTPTRKLGVDNPPKQDITRLGKEMERNKQALSILIQTYREEKCMYNPQDPLYHNKNARKEKLAVIGSKVRAVLPNATDDCKTRFMSLRSHFCGELKKKLESVSIVVQGQAKFTSLLCGGSML